MKPRWWLFALLAALGFALRLLGISWGLPDQIAPGEPPMHPDEFVPYVESVRIFSDPRGATFIWGGGFYMRLCWLARALAEALAAATGGAADPALPGVGPAHSSYALTLLILRCLNLGFAIFAAGCASFVARELGGAAAGAAAFALSLFFPGPVLDAHFARPDVLISAASAACLALCVHAARSGKLRALWAAGIACGAATATMLSGTIGLAPLAWTAIALAARSEPGSRSRWHTLFRTARCAAFGLATGYLACNTEALLHPRAFRAGLEIAFSSHQGGSWSFPTRLLSYVPLYAFGAPAALLAGVGAAWLALRGPIGSSALLAQLGFGILLLGRVGFDMMRHLEFLAVPAAILAALGVTQLAGWGARALRVPERPLRAAAVTMLAAFTLQVSLGLVLPLQLEEDARYRAGRWLAEHAGPGSRIGVTASFAGDQSYGPRVPIPAVLSFEGLMLKPEVDASGFSGRGLDFIATTDYARDRARGATAQAFVRDLFDETHYRLAATIGPGFGPLFLLADRLTSRLPADLSYTRAIFFLFEKKRSDEGSSETKGPRS